MRCSPRSLPIASAALWGLIGSGLVSAQETAPVAKPAGRPAQVRIETQPGARGRPVAPQADVPKIGDYWVGIQLGEVTDALKAQLEIESGLLIREVMPGSPAWKAELKAFDIIIAIGDKRLGEPADLIAAVNEAQDKELVLTIVRTGKRQTLKVAPAKRPAEAMASDATPADLEFKTLLNPDEVRQLDALIRRLEVQPNRPPLVLWSLRQPQNEGGRDVWEALPATRPHRASPQVPSVAEVELSKKLDTVLQRLEKLQADVDGLKKQ